MTKPAQVGKPASGRNGAIQPCPLLCRFLGHRRGAEVGALGFARVREAPRHEIAEFDMGSGHRPYGDLC